MNNPLQGETIYFSGFLKDDEDNIITDFDPYIFRALIKSRMLSSTFLFSNEEETDEDLKISITEEGLVTWKLIPDQSKNLQGETVLEIDCTEVSSKDKKLGKTVIFNIEETSISKHETF